MSFIEIKNLTHVYTVKNENGDIISEKTALNKLDFIVDEGEFVAVLGANGCGKTTLARHLNALLLPQEGSVMIDGKSTADASQLYAIRSAVGMVFQNPDNQLVAQILEDEVAFGPENLGLPTNEIRNRVDDALKSVGLTERKRFLVEHLSGGQKQLTAIAGVLAMQPKCMVLDEATSMLDPMGRREVLTAVENLRCEKHMTIVMITHDVEEALLADRICVMDSGRIILSGKPESIFEQEDEIVKYGLELPKAAELAGKLRRKGLPIRAGVMTEEVLRQELIRLTEEEGKAEDVGKSTKEGKTEDTGKSEEDRKAEGKEKSEVTGTAVQSEEKRRINQSNMTSCFKKKKYGREMLAVRHVTQRYFGGTDMEVVALKDVNFSVYAGEFVAVIGQTGSGKSTLIDLLGGLSKPTEGMVKFLAQADETGPGRQNAKNTGIVFQYPDHQLFEETVLEDVMFGPQNLGMEPDQAKKAARQALQMVKLPEETWDRSPLTLSGGEKRKAALAGVLAMKPEVLLLDEPIAGLARADRTGLFFLLQHEYREKGKTVLFTTHHMEDVEEFADRVLVLHGGAVVFDGSPKEVFRHTEELCKIGLDVPLKTRLEEEFSIDLSM